jgi:hypothetical protein
MCHKLGNHFWHTHGTPRWRGSCEISFRSAQRRCQCWCKRCTVCAKCTIGSRIVLDAPNGTPRCRGSSGSSFRPICRCASLDARWAHGLRRTYHWLGNHYGHARWNSMVTWVMSNVASVHLETVLVSLRDRCTVFAKHSIGLGIVLDAPDSTLRRRDSSGSSFLSVWRYC